MTDPLEEAAEVLHMLTVGRARLVRQTLVELGLVECPVCRRPVRDLLAHSTASSDPEHAVLAVMTG